MVLVAAVVYGVYWLLVARYFESTDDAYVAGNIVAVTSRENATVTALYADNTQAVKQGQLLIEMDPAIAAVDLQAAEANLARAVRRVRRQLCQRRFRRAQLDQARVAWPRRKAITSAASRPWPARCRARNWPMPATPWRRRKAAVNAARGGLAQANPASPASTSPTIPTCWRRKRSCAPPPSPMAHMRIVAPVDGVIAQRTVQVGQRVNAGAPLMAVVPLSNVWIDANFKEGQLARMRMGQPVEITTDIYGGEVTFTAMSWAWARAAARPLRCCRRRMHPATGSRSCSACRCASRWTRRS